MFYYYLIIIKIYSVLVGWQGRGRDGQRERKGGREGGREGERERVCVCVRERILKSHCRSSIAIKSPCVLTFQNLGR